MGSFLTNLFSFSKKNDPLIETGLANLSTFPPPKPLPLPPLSSSVRNLIYRGNIVDITENIAETINTAPMLCYGRNKVVKWIADRIPSHKKNAMLITGSPGLGKTLLINYLANLIVREEAPPGLQNRRILLLKNSPLTVLEVLNRDYAGSCILVCDEVHSIFDLSTSEERVQTVCRNSTVEQLKGLIDGTKVPFIGLTDRASSFRNDPAWKRRFHVFELKEMDIESCCELLEDSLASRFDWYAFNYTSRFPSVSIGREALSMAVKLSMVLLPDEFLPDKAFKLLEPAAIGTIHDRIEKASQEHGTRAGRITITDKDVFNKAVIDYEQTPQALQSRLNELDFRLTASMIPSTEPLSKMTEDLTLRAQRNEILPAYGRDKELEGIIAILSGIESNNVILRGPAGCGKTRIAEGLACRIVAGDVPEALKGKRVLLLNLNALLGDTKYRGELETKMKDFFDSAKRYKGTFILVIDELHRIMGAGRAEKSNYDVSNEFKEPLARGDLSTLGMTTTHEYYYIEKDAAFKRRFVTLDVEPFSVDQTIVTLKQDQTHYERKYSEKNQCEITFDDSAIEAAVYLSTKYLRDEILPSSGRQLFHTSVAFYAVKTPKDDRLCITEEHVIDYVARQYRKNTRKDRKDIKNELRELRALNHSSSNLISEHEAICRFSTNLVTEARKNKWNPLHGRDHTIDAMTEILSRPTINNILICGRAGTGKTTLVNELACRIANDRVSDHLKDKQILSLCFNDLLAAIRDQQITMKEFIDSAKKQKGFYVLFIDEIHIVFNAVINGVPFIESLKPLLASGDLCLIGATTNQDFEKLPITEAIRRRFEIIEMVEMQTDECVNSLKSLHRKYEEQFSRHLNKNIRIEENALETAVLMAKEYLPEEALPGSAIKLIEGASTSIATYTLDENVTISPDSIERYCKERLDRNWFVRQWLSFKTQYSQHWKVAAVVAPILASLSFIPSQYNQIASFSGSFRKAAFSLDWRMTAIATLILGSLSLIVTQYDRISAFFQKKLYSPHCGIAF